MIIWLVSLAPVPAWIDKRVRGWGNAPRSCVRSTAPRCSLVHLFRREGAARTLSGPKDGKRPVAQMARLLYTAASVLFGISTLCFTARIYPPNEGKKPDKGRSLSEFLASCFGRTTHLSQPPPPLEVSMPAPAFAAPSCPRLEVICQNSFTRVFAWSVATRSPTRSSLSGRRPLLGPAALFRPGSAPRQHGVFGHISFYEIKSVFFLKLFSLPRNSQLILQPSWIHAPFRKTRSTHFVYDFFFWVGGYFCFLKGAIFGIHI